MPKLKRKRAEKIRPVSSANWDFWRDGVSWSFISVFLQNREEVRLRYVEGWRPKVMPDFLEWGTAFHYLLEHVYQKYDAPPSREAIAKIMARYVKKQKLQRPDFRYTPKMEEMLALCQITAYEYFRYYSRDFDGWWQATEQEFVHWYTYGDGRRVKIKGVRDGLHRDADRDLWVIDTKTRSRIDALKVVEEFRFNFQVMLYMYDYWKKEGECPAGGIINNVKRAEFRRTKADTSLKILMDRVGEKIRAQPQQYFNRPTHPIVESDLEEWYAQQLIPIMEEVRAWAEGRLPTFVNPVGLYVGYRRTDYFDAMADDDFSGLIRKPRTKRK